MTSLQDKHIILNKQLSGKTQKAIIKEHKIHLPGRPADKKREMDFL